MVCQSRHTSGTPRPISAISLHSTTRLFKVELQTSKKAPALLPQRLADTGAKIIGTVHDEIIFEVPDRLANDAILKGTMIQAGKAYVSRVPIEVEVTIGDTWAEK